MRKTLKIWIYHLKSTQEIACLNRRTSWGPKEADEGSFRHSTEVPELQDVVGPKSMAPPLTAQTPGPNWLKFFVEAPQEDTFRGIEGIFEFRLRSWDIKAFMLIFEPFGGSENTLKWATKSSLSRLLGWNSKIPPMPLKVSSWGAYKKNLSQFGPGVWAVGGGAIDFGPTTSYNSGTSVCRRRKRDI